MMWCQGQYPHYPEGPRPPQGGSSAQRAGPAHGARVNGRGRRELPHPGGAAEGGHRQAGAGRQGPV